MKDATQIASTEAKTKFGEILRRCQQGESFVITQNGREAARLLPPTQATRRPMSIAEAVATIKAIKPNKPLRPDEIRPFIEDGRRF